VAGRIDGQVADRLIRLHAAVLATEMLHGKRGAFHPVAVQQQLPDLGQILMLGFGGAIARDAAPEVSWLSASRSCSVPPNIIAPMRPLPMGNASSHRPAGCASQSSAG